MQNKQIAELFACAVVVCLINGCATSNNAPVDSSPSVSLVTGANTSGIAHSIMPGRDELIRRALDRNPQIQSLRKVAEQADSLYRARSSGRQPELRWAYEEATTGEDQEDLQLGVRVFPTEPWAWLSDRTAAKAMAELARLDAQLAEQELIYKVSGLFIEAQWMKMRLTYTGMAVENAQSAALLNEALSDAGQSTLGEGLKVKLRQLDADRRASTLQAEYDGVLSLLGAEAGIDARALHPLIGEQDGRYRKDVPLTADATTLVNQAYANSLTLKSLDQQHTLMGLELKDDLAPVLPWLRHLQASWNESHGGGDDSWRVSGAITLPVFALFSGRGALIEALEAQIKTERANAQNALGASVQEQHAKWVAADKQARDFSEKSEPMLRDLVQQVQRLSTDESVSPEFMVEQQKVLLEAFEARSDIIYDRDAARLELRRLTGQL